MCWTCGGRCVECGEPSSFVIVTPSTLVTPSIKTYTCEEHRDGVFAKVRTQFEMREAAPWN